MLERFKDVSIKKKISFLISFIVGVLYILSALFLIYQINQVIIDKNIVSKLVIIISVTGISIITITYIVTRYISGKSLKDLPEIEKFAKQIASGRLDTGYKTKRKDELGKIVKSLINIRDRFSIVIQTAKKQAEQLSIAHESLKQTTDGLSKSALEQASHIEEISVIIEEILSNIKQSTTSTVRIDEISQGSFEKIRENNNNIQKTVSSFKTVSNETTIIEDIASQTKLLALNALIQAAQAGRFGASFNVVAQEVGKLAEKSKISADEISNLIKPSLKQVAQTGKVSQEIIPEIQEVSDLIKQVTVASVEQEKGISQINTSIQQLNEISQKNAATSEEISANFNQLINFVVELNELVKYFSV